MSADVAQSGWLVDGVDLAAVGVELTHDGAGLWDDVPEEPITSTFPGSDGSLDTGSRFPQYVRSTMYTIRATDPTAAEAALQALRRRCKPGRSVTLTRVMPGREGEAANVSMTTTARRQGAPRVAWLGKNNVLTVDIDWLITGGPFYGPSVNIASAAGTTSVEGDVRTRRMTLTLAAGASRQVTNTTNGFWFSFTTTVPTGGVVVDVEARTAKKVSDNSDMSAYLTWGKVLPFQLDPGANTITVSAGTASIDYQPAYL